ncbi:polysaccharide deacetylase family protein [Streptomyces ipomoeae]|uniref:polysaccharide deacetylase family protein n=1 Tax=Streptomyces ipomoeae TaxID=103232 RepID=UPI00031B3671|nr:polysaccharide deacetylase family protein [Streptomyces ipomoeae]MDX2701000.1 polysaccharide deacetylase family protein [Streptomyces ipomoeae]MDX2828730.1 polysaccharide deacetylase family protein [Streptomyces ipomoeae]MDX2846708.1 polysaccharide deacetylase family protein [Streptomyces ipomoeae]MDX2881262.1 polysaccharide deacetylase family protein [Streptomyces ipomoeae]TQE34509.1 polysaccharide deacetylase family protein [Streptomyces ipomoeae]
MQLVRQNDEKGVGGANWSNTRRGSGALRGGAAVLAVAAIVSGCAGGDSEGEPSGSRKRGTASPVHGQPGRQRLVAPAARALGAYAAKLRRAHAARVAAAKRWRLAEPPLTPPAPPERKPLLRTRKGFEVDDHVEDGLPPVFTTVPTRHKVVFLTIDDGAEKDPAFLRMMSELRIPYTAFLSDYLIKGDYGYFAHMRDRGVVLDNHTLNHRYMPALSYEAQKREICGMQDVIEKRYGERPTLFRPPYGSYDRHTLRAAKACGVKAVPLWNEEVFVDRWEYREGDRELRPGDIVLSHFRGRKHWKGTMPDMIRRFLNHVTAEGYAVARLEDYL